MNSNPPIVSVIVPAYNAETFIAETLSSVQAQTFQDFEVIIVDDGSTDGTVEVVRSFCKADHRFSLIQQQNAGVSTARNAAIQQARGEWLAFVDSDDVWLPEKLEHQLKLGATDQNTNLIFTNHFRWDGNRDLCPAYKENENLPEGDVTRLLIAKCVFLPSTVIVRRRAVVEAGLFNPKLRSGEDWDLWLRLAVLGLSVLGAREPLVRYRCWPGSLTSRRRFESLDANVHVLENNFEPISKKFPGLREEMMRSLGSAQNRRDLLAAQLSLNDKRALSKIMKAVWLRERLGRWALWYLFLNCPWWLGGWWMQRYVKDKISSATTKEPQKDKWSFNANEVAFISVIIPVYNGERFILETLRSVQEQTFQKFEAIVVDDGSTDNTAQIVGDFCKTDVRFVLIQQKNAGVSAARNAAIQRARGEWIAFLDGDDVWLPEKLARQTETLSANQAANFCFTNFFIWDGERDLGTGFPSNYPMPGGDISEQLIFGIRFVPSTALVRRSLVVDAGLFRKQMESSEDWDLWLRMAALGLRVCSVREPLVRYRQWPGSVTAKNRMASVAANLRVAENTLPVVAERFPDLRQQCQRSIATTRTIFQIMTARISRNEKELVDAIWQAWRRERRLKWLRWYAFLRWPQALGGVALQRMVVKKINARWPLP